MVVEDLHWIDPTSMELLAMLVDQVRPYGCSRCSPRAWNSSRPGRALARHFADADAPHPAANRGDGAPCSGGKPLPGGVVEQIVARTDGVPLFVEELTKMVLESGLSATEDDRYRADRPAAAAGHPDDAAGFTGGAPRSARQREGSGATERDAGPGISVRGAAGGIDGGRERAAARARATGRRRVSVPARYRAEAVYIFKHALIQEAAYQSLLKSTRRSITSGSRG